MAGTLVYSQSTELALELIEAARALCRAGLGDEIKAISINNRAQAEELAQRGVSSWLVRAEGVTIADTAALASVIARVSKVLESDTIVLSSDRRGKELAGRLAAKLDAGCLTDVKAVETAGQEVGLVRNALGGATVAVQTITSSLKVVAFAPGAFPCAEKVSDSGIVNELEITGTKATVRMIETRPKDAESTDIRKAKTLVVVGQGVEDKEDLPLVEELASVLGAEIGCSKPVATDKKWLSEDRVIGLSGKTCQPELALILGVSGQVQFTVGIREAKVIVSVNKDENAYMNQMADYVLVTDIKKALPEFLQALR
ncbi:MAG TPA: electron transfer flavoprotein subunit alpha/FixB family protein [Syntrophothermus lipocalidus]|nr:electron transfer flavoprotein subunit alpha/FixB family protein [Syntrophothermus lipocalidus]